jgi:hypothetical protein
MFRDPDEPDAGKVNGMARRLLSGGEVEQNVLF